MTTFFGGPRGPWPINAGLRAIFAWATSLPLTSTSAWHWMHFRLRASLHSGFKWLKPATKSVHLWYFTNFLSNRFLQILKFPFPVLLFTSIFKISSNCCRHKYDQLISRTFSVWFLVGFSHLAQPCIAAAAPALPWPCSLCCCLFQWLATAVQPTDCQNLDCLAAHRLTPPPPSSCRCPPPRADARLTVLWLRLLLSLLPLRNFASTNDVVRWFVDF